MKTDGPIILLNGVCNQIPNDLDSVVLIANGMAYTKSDVALRTAALQHGLWPVLKILLIVPRPIRNCAYDVVAKNRYRWFGKKSTCMVPSAELRARLPS